MGNGPTYGGPAQPEFGRIPDPSGGTFTPYEDGDQTALFVAIKLSSMLRSVFATSSPDLAYILEDIAVSPECGSIARAFSALNVLADMILESADKTRVATAEQPNETLSSGSLPDLKAMLGDSLERVLEEGLSALDPQTLGTLFRDPENLLALRQLAFGEGRNYWLGLLASQADPRSLVDKLLDAQTRLLDRLNNGGEYDE